MGLLDDAIREHLDLKRRRGADPTEIERAEREALGPVRRGPEPADPDDLAQDASIDAPLDRDTTDDERWHEESFSEEREPFPGAFPETGEMGAHEPHPAYDEATLDHDLPDPTGSSFDGEPDPYDVPLPRDEPDAYRHPVHPAEEPGAHASEESLGGVDAEPESTHPLPHAAPASPQPRNDETIEYSVEDAIGGPTDDDVLEETPEFLQDAPEHDRLWFDQRPPKDFDFNE